MVEVKNKELNDKKLNQTLTQAKKEELSEESNYEIVESYEIDKFKNKFRILTLCSKEYTQGQKNMSTVVTNLKPNQYVSQIKINENANSDEYGKVTSVQLGVDSKTGKQYTPEKAKEIANFSTCYQEKEIERSLATTYTSMVLNGFEGNKQESKNYYTSDECNVRLMFTYENETPEKSAEKAVKMQEQYKKYCESHKHTRSKQDYVVIPYTTSWNGSGHMGVLLGNQKGEFALFDSSGAFKNENGLGSAVENKLIKGNDKIASTSVQDDIASTLGNQFKDSCSWCCESCVDTIINMQKEHAKNKKAILTCEDIINNKNLENTIKQNTIDNIDKYSIQYALTTKDNLEQLAKKNDVIIEEVEDNKKDKTDNKQVAKLSSILSPKQEQKDTTVKNGVENNIVKETNKEDVDDKKKEKPGFFKKVLNFFKKVIDVIAPWLELDIDTQDKKAMTNIKKSNANSIKTNTNTEELPGQKPTAIKSVKEKASSKTL